MASPCIPWGTTALLNSVVVPASHITAGHVNRGGRAAEIGYVVEGGGCSHPRLGCWYRRHQVRRENQEPGDSDCRGGSASFDGHGLVDRLTKADDPETVDQSLCRGVCMYARADVVGVSDRCGCAGETPRAAAPGAPFPTNRSWTEWADQHPNNLGNLHSIQQPKIQTLASFSMGTFLYPASSMPATAATGLFRARCVAPGGLAHGNRGVHYQGGGPLTRFRSPDLSAETRRLSGRVLTPLGGEDIKAERVESIE